MCIVYFMTEIPYDMVQDFRVRMIFFLNYLLKEFEQCLHITSKLSSRYVVAVLIISVVRDSS